MLAFEKDRLPAEFDDIFDADCCINGGKNRRDDLR
jgi:hypothetical protein